MEWYGYVLLVAGLLIVAFIFFLIGMLYRKKVAEREIGSAETEATRIINEAIKGGENKKREMLVEAKEEIHKSRTEYEKEVKERRADLQKQERRLQQKEESLDKKLDAFERKEDDLRRRQANIAATQDEVEMIKKSQLETLEKLSGLTQEEAKNHLLKNLENECKHDAALKIKEIETNLKDNADQLAREIISIAIQRCAADHAAETTVSVVALPNDEMKGRIIGREGRNIRTLEAITGVDLIIDDTPEAITVSCFDPVRREVARLALEKLIADGRIHPTRIEDLVEKARKEVDRVIKQEGERATFETGINNLHPELIKLLGRQKYRTACCMTSASLSTTRWKAATSSSALSWPASTTNRPTSSTPSRRTTTTSSRAPSLPASCRRPMPSRPLVPAHAARTWRIISAVWKSSRS